MSALTTILADVRKGAEFLEPIISALIVVQTATRLGGPAAEEALRIARSALSVLEAGAQGSLTKDQVLEELAHLHVGLANNDATADAALAARFPPVGGG